jgi:hypothetical protein
MDELRKQNIALGKTIQSLDGKLSSTVKMMTATTSKAMTSASNAMKSAFKSIPTASRTTKVSLAVSKPKAKKRR